MADVTFDAIKIGIASPEMIRQWSFGEVDEKGEYVNEPAADDTSYGDEE